MINVIIAELYTTEPRRQEASFISLVFVTELFRCQTLILLGFV